MSWLDIFKRRPAANLHPTTTGSLYTAKEVAKAGVDDAQVQRLVQVITAKAYVIAQKGYTGIRYSHENANLLKLAGQQLKGMGYSVRFDPGDDGFSPYLAISW